MLLICVASVNVPLLYIIDPLLYLCYKNIINLIKNNIYILINLNKFFLLYLLCLY